MNLEDLKKLHEDLKNTHENFFKAGNEFALKNCGYSVGDVVDVIGFSHRGKKMRVVNIEFILTYSGNFMARIYGVVLKNDGTGSKNQSEFSVSLMGN